MRWARIRLPLPAVAALALGIGANTAIFSVVNTVLLKPFAYSNPERIVMFQNIYGSGLRSGSASADEFNWWRARSTAIENISAYAFGVANLTGDFFPEQIPIMRVSADFFRLCGAAPIRGRTFTDQEDKAVVLAYSFWQRRFTSDPGIIGQRLTLNGEDYEITGVAPENLEKSQVAEQSLLTGDVEIDTPPDVYLAFHIDPNSLDRGHGFNVAGRLKPGVTVAAANAELRAGYAEYARKWTDLAPGASFGVEPLRDAITGGVRGSLLILSGAVGLVLLVACANVASLLLARAAVRKREMAIRAAVGASRGAIIRQLLSESLRLSLAGGALGLILGDAGIHALLRLSPAIPRIGISGVNVTLDWRVAAFTLALSICTGVLSGLAPAWQSSSVDLSSALKPTTRGSRTRALLVTAEIALAVVLSIGAALLIRSFISIRHVNPGFDPRDVVVMRVSLAGPQFAKAADASRVIQESTRRLRAIPGVESVASSCCVPLDTRIQAGFEIPGRPPGPSSQGVAGRVSASAGYFETLHIPLLRGRTFTQRDETGPPAAIVNETFANQFWQDGDALNARLKIGGGDPLAIVGIAADVRDRGLNRDPRPTVYIASSSPGGLLRLIPWAWIIRTRGAPAPWIPQIEKELREATGGLPAGSIRTMQDIVARSTAAGDFNTLVMTIFGASALLLAAIGVYGLMAHSVAERVREIGIRLALGARSREIRRMILFEGLRIIGPGVVLGAAAGLGLARLMSALLFGVQTHDPLVFSIAPLVLAAAGIIAVWLPAARASRVEPAIALRHE